VVLLHLFKPLFHFTFLWNGLCLRGRTYNFFGEKGGGVFLPEADLISHETSIHQVFVFCFFTCTGHVLYPLTQHLYPLTQHHMFYILSHNIYILSHNITCSISSHTTSHVLYPLTQHHMFLFHHIFLWSVVLLSKCYDK
jgi:hypothetical protein